MQPSTLETGTGNPLLGLLSQGQSVWLDYIRRSLISSGELARLIRDDGLRGITSNPTIFEKAITGSGDYDGALRDALARNPRIDSRCLYEILAIEDIRLAADALRPIYEQFDRQDGFVSLEVSPALAHNTEGTVAEGRRLWQSVSRPNLMIKVPATREGIPAVESLIAEGINVNVTLMFSLAHYEAVACAYLRGLTRCAHPDRVNSVASFFVSRVDTAVDRALEAIGGAEATRLRGQVAVANCRSVYGRFREIFHGEPFSDLRRRGAAVQRPLWASTGTKNPAYSDVKYVEELIGTDTVNTMPPATIDAFRDHGRVREGTLLERMPVLSDLAKLGIHLEAIADQLQAEGVASFQASFNQILTALDKKRQKIISGVVDRQTLSIGSNQAAVSKRLRIWNESSFACRFWRKDATLWSPDKSVDEITNRLGWLSLPELMHEHIKDLESFADEVRAEGFRHAVLLGMGGSSLAPEVFQKTFRNARGYPELIVLDSTHPAAVRAVERQIEPERTLFIVSSKSGTTIEPLSFFRYFWSRETEADRNPGRHFIAITDPGTPLLALARERRFRRIFEAPPDLGGRYSALSVFGLVPAAIIGVDLQSLLDRAWTMAEACAFCVNTAVNPGATLGAALGELARAGKNKVTFVTSPSLSVVPDWIEQLMAESTGKSGKGIVPIVAEPLSAGDNYGPDRVFVELRLEAEDGPKTNQRLWELAASGHPVIYIDVDEKADLGQEFFRWEFAVASAGAVLGIHPFNQPDVQLAKELAHRAMEKAGIEPRSEEDDDLISVFSDQLCRAVRAWAATARQGDYVALQAYVARTAEATPTLLEIRQTLHKRLHIATTLGYGPRFLHSTGQLHKGGPNTGLFLQMVDDPPEDMAVPETGFTFGALIRAQAAGDAQAMRQRGRRVLRVNLGTDVAAGLQQLLAALNA